MKLAPETKISLLTALDETVESHPAVMPTAPILREEAAKVNAEIDRDQKSPSPSTGETPKRGRGRPRKDGATATTSHENGQSKGFVGGAGQRPVDPGAAQRIELAKQVVTLVEQSGCMIAGEAAKMAETEKSALGENLDNYMKAKNINDIPPGLLLAMGLGMYYGRVLNTQGEDKIPIGAKVIFWFKNKFSRKKYARSHNGNDGIGQDNAGKTAGQAV